MPEWPTWRLNEIGWRLGWFGHTTHQDSLRRLSISQKKQTDECEAAVVMER
jgi:hypothetical protein